MEIQAIIYNRYRSNDISDICSIQVFLLRIYRNIQYALEETCKDNVPFEIFSETDGVITFQLGNMCMMFGGEKYIHDGNEMFYLTQQQKNESIEKRGEGKKRTVIYCKTFVQLVVTFK